MSHHPCCGHCNSGSGCDTQEVQENKMEAEVSYILHKFIIKTCTVLQSKSANF